MRHLRGQAVLAAAAVGAVGIAACGGSQSGAGGQAKLVRATSSPSQHAAMMSGGAQRAANGHVSVTMADFGFTPSKITAAAGKLKVTVRNMGHEEHEFVLLRTSRAPAQIPVRGDRVSEASSVGEVSEQRPGATASHTFRLRPGRYVFICNVAGHYQAGMHGSLVVR